MKNLYRYWREYTVAALLVASVLVWLTVYFEQSDNKLRVYFLDVGQGDAILIDSPMHGRVLIDGGPDRRVLSELGRILPFADKNIDVVIATHPDADHITGLVETLQRYESHVLLEPGVESESDVDEALHTAAEERDVKVIEARRGMDVDLGGGVHLLILFPNQNVSDWETNDASIVAKLSYRETSFLLTGDSTKRAEYMLLGLNEKILDSDVLKAGHHGSDTSTSPLYARAVSPEYAVISAGKNNRYGHPKQSVLDILNKVGAKIISTADAGTIEFVTDGLNLSIK